MDVTQIYAIALGGAALCCILARALPQLDRYREHVALQVSKHLFFRYVIDRHALIGPWTVASVCLQMMYLMVNIFCVWFQTNGMAQAGVRAGSMSLINLAPLLCGHHFDFLADIFGLSLETWRVVHRSSGIMVFALVALHVLLAAVSKAPLFWTLGQHPFVITVSGLCSGWHATKCGPGRAVSLLADMFIMADLSPAFL